MAVENLVDEFYAFTFPVLVGGGKRWSAVACMRHLVPVETRSLENRVLMARYPTNADYLS